MVTTRPDAIVVHFGHNNVWDIRVAENHKDKIGTFAELFEHISKISADYERLDQDPWFREYVALMAENYSKPYPRPFPCGSLILGFDRRRVELLGHALDIASGMCSVGLRVDDAPVIVRVFVDVHTDRLWVRAEDSNGAPVASPFERIKLLPDPDGLLDNAPLAGTTMFTALSSSDDTAIGTTNAANSTAAPDTEVQQLGLHLTAPKALPDRGLIFRQELPIQTPDAELRNPGHARDRAFCLSAATSVDLVDQPRRNWHGQIEAMGSLERTLVGDAPFVACVQLDEGLASAVVLAGHSAPAADVAAFEPAAAASQQFWAAFWERSGIALDDTLLEATWYRNLYFLNCAARPGTTCPGLFANWSYRKIGTAWHGDYHMNYNQQQPFWGTFSSNHIENHLPYVDLIDHLLPLSRAWVRDYYGLRGAAFPHSAYPVEMNIPPYPVPTWGWEICETPWSVQSLWWHYSYTRDRDFLEQRAFEPIKAAVQFLTDYILRPEARGERWNDPYYLIFPTVPPELYGLMPGFRNNYDCLVDLTLTRFVLRAFIDACAILRRDADESELLAATRDVLDHLPPNPTAESRIGTVFVSVPGEDSETVYNVPNPAMTVFPGEEHGLHSPLDEYQIAANSYRNMRNEGGNELVFANLQAARLGILDLERFKRQIRYCMLPNGTCTDMVLQVHGRYTDTLAYDSMAPMGIWLENFALPVVLNECLLHSYTGTLRSFPNWPSDQHAEFRTLRAVGAFLVSAAFADSETQWVEVFSEAGGPLRLITPWASGARSESATGEQFFSGELLEIQTQPGETIRLFKYAQ